LHEVEQIAHDEVPAGVPMSQWALAWCLRDPAVTAVIPGCKNVEQVESNARAADLLD
jgi:myo-inositol catabolism protein IolS